MKHKLFNPVHNWSFSDNNKNVQLISSLHNKYALRNNTHRMRIRIHAHTHIHFVPPVRNILNTSFSLSIRFNILKTLKAFIKREGDISILLEGNVKRTPFPHNAVLCPCFTNLLLFCYSPLLVHAWFVLLLSFFATFKRGMKLAWGTEQVVLPVAHIRTHTVHHQQQQHY